MRIRNTQLATALLVALGIVFGTDSANAGAVFPPQFCVSEDPDNPLDYAAGYSNGDSATLTGGGKINCPLFLQNGLFDTGVFAIYTTNSNATYRLRTYDASGDRIGNFSPDATQTNGSKLQVTWNEFVPGSDTAIILVETTSNSFQIFSYRGF